MKQNKVKAFFIIKIISIYIVVCGIILISACQKKAITLPNEVATQDKPVTSPSGNYILTVTSGDNGTIEYQSFEILNNNEEILFSSSDQFAIRHTTYFLWDDDDRVWVYSGDLGTFFWELNPDTSQWEKFVYAKNDVPAPAFLKQIRPKWHKK